MSLPDWQQIDTVLLDMDGTLLDLHFDNYFWLDHVPAQYAAHHGLSEEEALAELNKSFVGLRGTLNWYCLDYWTELTGLPIADLKRDVQDKIGFRPHVKDFLQRLRDMGKRTVIVTNAHRYSVDLKMEHTGLDQLVDCVISSHDYQEPKESQAFWDHLASNETFDPARTLLIDDSEAVLESAARWGIGWLLAIYHPDSQKPPKTDGRFPGVNHFDELKF
ncbi:MAG: haloacid dehalogenase [Oceanospirillaceae bacterium]|uniref:GMP/IMP nucleotidase n=1 Tax=unclassified Thalassolituus TaxID=2624967 RepID=UPI000C0B2C8A|nr:MULTISPECIES: GMP/IMP nucleotidase [unclassified Thalassolituus]MAK91011.1 haloacid dehalogenase [Thalassolituus sp.]MAS24335.1 haloacid dehalogenase [Oceanospirillaceae bacterium]MAX99304.1 haloacid dehalogenase [Oceanospirillaceae bacterium]MBL33874.1 haloacid dehalogenase [Oceanospirillaceae bacterium]MBS51279.1 haloacid dehalogenase [Oceanospirillaceae bacterium]|tara:strand:- start:507 stop:1163 length:657 start_codon:yes stop_codon:yes gene_type:complete